MSPTDIHSRISLLVRECFEYDFCTWKELAEWGVPHQIIGEIRQIINK